MYGGCRPCGSTDTTSLAVRMHRPYVTPKRSSTCCTVAPGDALEVAPAPKAPLVSMGFVGQLCREDKDHKCLLHRHSVPPKPRASLRAVVGILHLRGLGVWWMLHTCSNINTPQHCDPEMLFQTQDKRCKKCTEELASPSSGDEKGTPALSGNTPCNQRQSKSRLPLAPLRPSGFVVNI